VGKGLLILRRKERIKLKSAKEFLFEIDYKLFNP
jgi:hypothetical protein